MKKLYIIFLSKWYCRVQIFLGLCLAMLFICSSNNTFADTFGPSGYPATPTPIANFINYSVSVLNYDGYSHQSPLDYPTIQVANTNNVSFFDTYLPYCVNIALENYDRYFNTNYANVDISDIFDALDDIYDFDPYDPQIAFNFFIDGSYLYFVPDYHVNHFNQNPDSDYFYMSDSSRDWWRYIPLRCLPTYIIVSYDDNDTLKYKYVNVNNSNNVTSVSSTSTPYFSLNGSNSNNNNNFGTFIFSTQSSGWSITDLTAYNYGELSFIRAYSYNLSNGNKSTNSFFSGIPLVIMNPICSFIDEFSMEYGSWTFYFENHQYGASTYSYRSRLTPYFDDFDEFYNLCLEYKSPASWFDYNFSGLTYTFDIPIDPLFTPTPIPTFGPIYTPTPFPTNIFNPVVTPIDLPINPVINIGEYGSPWDFIAGIAPLLSSALHSGTVRFFVTTIEYIYNSSLFFEVILLLVPSICLIAFIIGRLKRK